MALNIISNYAANVAHRNLQESDTMATRSLSKLSSGTRVVSARDDAASMAIGARLNATTQALKTATVNVGQANSMLQIADGAMATIDDVLVRMKTLATQAASGNLSDTERGFLDDEFQLLKDEIDRIASSTNFNGVQLLGDGGDVDIDFTTVGAGTGADLTNANGFSGFAITDNNFWASDDTEDGVADNNFAIDITAGPGNSVIMTITANVDDATGAYTQSIDITSYQTGGANEVGVGQQASLNFDEIGLSISINSGLTATIDAAVGGADWGAANGENATVDMAADNGQRFEADVNFQIGANNTAADRLSVTLTRVDLDTLGLATTIIGDQAGAQAGIESVNSAIDALQAARASIGTFQNRLDFAGQNLSTTTENTESARSVLLDLDVASEMTTFTSKQILVQSGVAMLAQANQMPQNLLRLLQQ
ncbi:flagellin [Thalassospira sp. A3_1]|uniref:flagellin N-terminal helical domain-containing protein n=1 Tax=Thalassospira sp. A3_1 TaxID=2821088 RepID=UPI001ADC7E81|nr:flagellin [Thalassospira sp. A3_1]MBO9507786.1 flagellin [Thalassospira sp. A3_1]